jgi:hypothetical protein
VFSAKWTFGALEKADGGMAVTPSSWVNHRLNAQLRGMADSGGQDRAHSGSTQGLDEVQTSLVPELMSQFDQSYGFLYRNKTSKVIIQGPSVSGDNKISTKYLDLYGSEVSFSNI